jgi:dCMP deaminase
VGIMENSRPSWDDYFINIAVETSKRATCPRKAVGAVVTVNNRIVSTGYNGSPPRTPHCTENGCILVDNHCVRVLHAEANAVINAGPMHDKFATIYCTLYPCDECAKLILAAGISRVVYKDMYPNEITRRIFVLAKKVITVEQYVNKG